MEVRFYALLDVYLDLRRGYAVFLLYVINGMRIDTKKKERQRERDRGRVVHTVLMKKRYTNIHVVYQYTCSKLGERKTEIRVNRTLMEKTVI